MNDAAKKPVENAISTEANVANQELGVSPFRIFQTEMAVIQEAVRANLGDSAIGNAGVEVIPLPGGGSTNWNLPEGTTPKSISAVILNFQDRRAYFTEQPNGNSRLECSSPDAKRGDTYGDCKSCKYAKPRSSPDGSRQACKLTRELLVIRQKKLLPSRIPLPPTSIIPCQNYFYSLASDLQPIYNVFTNISLEKAIKDQTKVYTRAVFSRERLLTQKEGRVIAELRAMFQPSLAQKNMIIDADREEIV